MPSSHTCLVPLSSPCHWTELRGYHQTAWSPPGIIVYGFAPWLPMTFTGNQLTTNPVLYKWCRNPIPWGTPLANSWNNLADLFNANSLQSITIAAIRNHHTIYTNRKGTRRWCCSPSTSMSAVLDTRTCLAVSAAGGSWMMFWGCWASL